MGKDLEINDDINKLKSSKVSPKYQIKSMEVSGYCLSKDGILVRTNSVDAALFSTKEEAYNFKKRMLLNCLDWDEFYVEAKRGRRKHVKVNS